MGARDTNAIHSAGGRLAYGVTNRYANGGVFPYDGTELGLVSSVYAIPPNGVYYLPMEEDGSLARAVYIGGDAIAGVKFANWDADILDALYPGVAAAGGLAAGILVSFPANVGQTVAPLTNLYYEPDSDEHLAWLIPQAIPEWEESERLWFSHYRRQYFPVIFRSQADAGGVAIQLGLAADLMGPTQAPVSGLTANTDSGDVVTLEWTNPASLANIIVRRAAGATAPTSVTGGTGIYSGVAVETIDDATATTGTWSYSVFAQSSTGVYSIATSVTIAATILDNPNDIFGDDLLMWWAPYDSSYRTVSSGLVTALTNKATGAGAAAVSQAAQAGGPALGDDVLDGRDALDCPGGVGAGWLASANGGWLLNDTYAIFARLNVSATDGGILSLARGAGQLRYSSLMHAAGTLRWNVRTSEGQVFLTPGGFSLNTDHTVTLIQESTSSRRAQVDDEAEDTDATSNVDNGAQPVTGFWLGDTPFEDPAEMVLGEVVVVKGIVPSAGQIAAVKAWLER